MAVSTRRRNITVAAVSTAVVAGAVGLLFQTYPHLKQDTSDFIGKYIGFCGSSKKDSKSDSLLGESTFIVPETSAEEWTEEQLKSYLSNKEITAPEGASKEDLVALVKSIQ